MMKENTEGTATQSLPSVPKTSADETATVEYVKAHRQDTIGNRTRQPGFDFELFFRELGAIFMQIIGDLGIKTLPDKATEQRIIHYMMNYYRDFTTQEIRKAFELAIAGELAVDTQHYNSFDLKYICQILNAYRIKRNTAVSRSQKLLSKPKTEEVTQEQKDGIRQNFIRAFCELYEKYCRTGELGIMSLSLVYDVLVQESVLSVSPRRWSKLLDKAQKRVKQKISKPKDLSQHRAVKQLLENFNKPGNEKETLERMAKETAVLEFMEKCRKSNTDLRGLFTKHGLIEAL